MAILGMALGVAGAVEGAVARHKAGKWAAWKSRYIARIAEQYMETGKEPDFDCTVARLGENASAACAEVAREWYTTLGPELRRIRRRKTQGLVPLWWGVAAFAAVFLLTTR